MTPDEIAAAVRAALPASAHVREVKMFGGIGFMLDDNMVVAASKRGLLARVGQARQAKSASTKGVRPMEMNGRVMKDYVFIDPEALSKAAVDKWLKLARAYVETLPAKPTGRTAKAKAKGKRK